MVSRKAARAYRRASLAASHKSMEDNMLLCLVSQDAAPLQPFMEALEREENVRLVTAASAKAALETCPSQKPDVVVLEESLPDMAPKDLLMGLLQINAMINTAMISEITDEEFHEKYEGFGVLMRLPSPPGQEDATALLRKIRSVLSIR